MRLTCFKSRIKYYFIVFALILVPGMSLIAQEKDKDEKDKGGDGGGIVPMAICPGSYLSPSELYPSASGGVFIVDLVSSCPTYTVVENLDWVSYTKSGKRVTLTISSNSGPARDGVVSIGQLPLNIYQACGNTPGAAGSISGTSSVCPGQTSVSYSVAAISNATGYNWSLPSGASIASGGNTNSITVNYSTGASSGNMSVYGTGCGSGSPSPNFPVTVNSIGSAGSISGPSTVCSGSTNTFSISPVSGATSYVWTIPSGSSGSSSSNSINVTFGTNGGNVSVYAINSGNCLSNTSTKSVSIPTSYAYTVQGGGTTCPGVGISVWLQGSTSGVEYRCYLNGVWQSGDIIYGNGGNNVSWSKHYPGTYTIKAIVSGCEIPMSGSVGINNHLLSANPTGINSISNPMCLGDGTTLTVSGGSLGTGASWKWYTGGCPPNGTLVYTGNSYPVNPSSTTTYWVRAEGTCNNTNCASTTLTVTTPPIITQNPSNVTICDGAPTSFSVSASGAASYQWQQFIGDWTNIPGATGSIYYISSSTGMDGRSFRCIVTGPGPCNLTSNSYSAGITFSTLSQSQVSITGDAAICPGNNSTVTLNGSVSGRPYNLYLDGQLLSSEEQTGTGSSLSWQVYSGGIYTVKGTSEEGCAIPMTGSATISMRTPSTPPSSIDANPSTTKCPNESVTLTLVGGSLEPGYGVWKWYSGTAPCGSVLEREGVTNITVSPEETTNYYVRAEGGCAPTSCVPVTVQIREMPTITAQPVNSTVYYDQNATFLVSATGTDIEYQWQYSSDGITWNDFNGSPAAGWNTENLTILNSELYSRKLYRCAVTSPCNVVFSDSVRINVIVKYLDSIPSLTREINTSDEVGTTAISTSVNQMGAATINIPIFAPPGTNGMSPSVSISYNSQSGNGLLGYGWHIGGVSSIRRTGRVLYYDNEAAGITYTAADKLALDGERLMVSEGTYGTAGSVYFPESNPFSKITAYGSTGNGPTYFKQETKEGITYEYGNSADSRHFASNVNSTVYAWLLNRAVDNNGNYVKYNYTNFQGENWLRSIEYTGNSLQSMNPYDSLEFVYTTRTTDASYAYAGQGYIPKTKLLHYINVYCQGIKVKKYEFNYANGFYTQLVEIKEFDKDESKIYNPVIIDWGDNGTFFNTHNTSISRPENDEGVVTGDFNGDGKEELAYWGSDALGSYLNVYKLESNYFQSVYSETFDTAYFAPYPKQYSSVTNGDIDGDGADDLIFTSADSLHIYYGNQSEQQMFVQKGTHIYNGHIGYSTIDSDGNGIGEITSVTTGMRFINFDGDSRTDKIILSTNGYELRTSTSSSGIINHTYLNSSYASSIFEGDFNGDFRTDLLLLAGSASKIYDYNGSGYIVNNNYTIPFGSFDPTAAGNAMFVRDINDDGKSDIITISTHFESGSVDKHIWNIYLSRGLSFTNEEYDFPANDPAAYGDYVFGDFYGKGSLNCLYQLRDIIELKKDNRINLVEAVLNGLNHKSSFSYGYNVPPSDALSRPSLDTLIYCTYPGSVVNSITSVGSNQVQRTVSYTYANPVVNLTGKGILGFANQSVSDNTSGFTRIVKTNVDETRAYTYPAEQIVKDGSGNNISESYLTGSKKSYPWGGYFGYISQTRSKDLVHNLTDTASYYYDNYGNNTLTILSQNGELVTETSNQFIQKGTWCPARISSTKVVKSSYNDTSADSTTSEFSYDDLGRLTNSRVFADLPDSLSTHLSYNAFGNVVKKRTKATGGVARYETYEFDAKKRFATIVTLGNLTSSYEFDPATGSVLESTDPNGLVTTYSYNGFGRQTEQRLTQDKYTTTAYNWSIGVPEVTGAVYSVTQTDGISSSTIWYDDNGKRLRISSEGFDGSGIYTDMQYSDKGEITRASRPYFSSSSPVWNTYSYDDLGRIETLSVNGAAMSYSYNDNQTTSTLEVTGTDRENSVSNNGLGQVSSVINNNVNLGFEYDNKGKLVNVTPPVSGSEVGYGYDSHALLNQETDPDRGTSGYRYNSFGELVNYENAGGDIDSVIYDCMGRDSIRIRNSVSTYYTYYTSGVGKGRVSQVHSQNKYKKFIYDIYGNITRECDSISATESFPFNYRYDEHGRLSWKMYPGGFAVTYNYNGNGYLEYIKRASDSSVLWQCNTADAEGNITQYRLAAGNITVDKSFNSYGYLKEIKTTAGAVKQWLTYQFDEKTGDLTLRRDTLRGITEEFRYDVFDQLLLSIIDQDTLKMEYDDLGNITYKSNVGDYYYNDTRVHAVDSISSSQNLNRQNIEYNNFNKPIFIANDNDSLVYQYNVIDDRIKAFYYYTAGLKKTVWYSGSYEKTLAGDSTTHYNYINGPDGPIALAIQSNSGTIIYYICKDHLGSITGIMNSSGVILEEYNYDPWGKRRNPTNWSYASISNPTYTQHGFTGHEHLDMFELINMNGRIYDSEIARFLNPDPVIQNPYNLLNYNRYTYCLNNPLKYTDPSGYRSKYLFEPMENFINYERPGGSRYQFNWGGYYYNFGTGKYQNDLGVTVPFSSVYSSLYNSGSLIGVGNPSEFLEYVSSGLSIYLYNLYGRENLVASMGDPGLFSIVGGGYVATNNTASVFPVVASAESASGGGGSGIFDGLGFLSGITSNGANIRANDIYNSKGWRNNSGRHFSSDLLKRGANGRYVRGVQGYRNSANLARNTAQSVRMMGNTASALGGAVIVADVLVNSEITVSNGINAFMTGISFTGIGAPIAGVWFVADFGMEIFTGRSFSERIDANTPSLDWNW